MVPYRRDAAALALGFAALLETGSASPACDPCIDRSEVKIGVVHHGQPSTDVYWVSAEACKRVRWRAGVNYNSRRIAHISALVLSISRCFAKEKMNSAIMQGAKDMSIDLHFDADQNEGMTQEEIHDKMAVS